MEVTVNDIHDTQVMIDCVNVGTYVDAMTKGNKTFDLNKRFKNIIAYIVKLERENC